MLRYDSFCYWIRERERVRINKEGGTLKPWSKDPVFQETYFCNVRREDDKVTRWIRENWSHPDDINFEFAMCMARLFNKINTLEIIGFPTGWTYKNVCDTMNFLAIKADVGETIWGNAYVVTTHGRKMGKLDYAEEILIWILESSLHEDIHNCKTLEGAWQRLTKFEGFGSFMAAQVVADIKNTVGHPLHRATDWWTFSAPGPGSLRGLEWLYGEKVSPGKYKERIDHLFLRLAQEKDIPALCQQDVQNCLCEFDKYMRVKTKTGRSKRKYNGTR